MNLQLARIQTLFVLLAVFMSAFLFMPSRVSASSFTTHSMQTVHANTVSHTALQDPCNDNVIDGGQFFTDQAAIVRKIEEIYQRTGAIIRLRTFAGYESLNYPPEVTNIDSYVGYMMVICPAWAGTTGYLTDNYIVMVFSVVPGAGKADAAEGPRYTSNNSSIAADNNVGQIAHEGRLALESKDFAQAHAKFQQAVLQWLDNVEQSIDFWYSVQQDIVEIILWSIGIISAGVILVWLLIRFGKSGGSGSGSGGSGSGSGGYRSSTVFYSGSDTSSSSSSSSSSSTGF